MAIEQELLALEERFWTGDADFYRKNLDAECLCVFTDMAGVMTREQVAATIPDGKRWSGLVIEEKGFRRLGEDVALLSYRASAKRPDGEPYRAVVSSGYVRHDGAWKMAFHQQTPLR